MPDAVAGTFKSVLRSKKRECQEPAVHGIDRQAGPGNSRRVAPSVRATMATVWISAPSQAYCVCTAGQLMARHMQRHGPKCGRHPLPGRVCGTNPERGVRHRVRRLMRLMRSVRVYQTPNTSKKHPRHKIYPYLLRGLTIDRPNRVPLDSNIKCNTQRPWGIGCCDGQTVQAPQRRGTWRDFGGASARGESSSDRPVAGTQRLDDRSGTASGPSGGRARPALLCAVWRCAQ